MRNISRNDKAGRNNIQKIGRSICLILIFCVSPNCAALELVDRSNANTIEGDANSNLTKNDNSLYTLDISHPSISQPIELATGDVQGAKFVQVEVAKVLNPKRYALTFEVHYQPTSNGKIYLGSFSLYPADNPGKFIVPTQGKVRNEGLILLSMLISDKVDTRSPLKVEVKKIKFLKGS
jgi:hypothetical protein